MHNNDPASDGGGWRVEIACDDPWRIFVHPLFISGWQWRTISAVTSASLGTGLPPGACEKHFIRKEPITPD